MQGAMKCCTDEQLEDVACPSGRPEKATPDILFHVENCETCASRARELRAAYDARVSRMWQQSAVSPIGNETPVHVLVPRNQGLQDRMAHPLTYASRMTGLSGSSRGGH
jgi:hypothetical protein